MTYYRRKPADASILAGALAAGAALGAATFYLVKLWLQREPLEPEGAAELPGGESRLDAGPDEPEEGTGDGEIDRETEPEPETSEGAESSR